MLGSISKPPIISFLSYLFSLGLLIKSLRKCKETEHGSLHLNAPLSFCRNNAQPTSSESRWMPACTSDFASANVINRRIRSSVGTPVRDADFIPSRVFGQWLRSINRTCGYSTFMTTMPSGGEYECSGLRSFSGPHHSKPRAGKECSSGVELTA